jgi:hypothetical protein
MDGQTDELIRVELGNLFNSKKICFSSFNDVDLFCSMLADCCMPRCRGWGTMVAVGQRRPPWLAGACILPSFG